MAREGSKISGSLGGGAGTTGDGALGQTVGIVGGGRAPTTFVDYIDLADTSKGFTKWYKVPLGKSLVSVTIEVTSGEVWSSGTLVDMQWGLKVTDADDSFAVTYSPAVQFTSTKTSIPAISTMGRGWVRVKTTTATSGDDPAAKVILGFF